MKLTMPKGVHNKVAWERAKEEVKRVLLTVDFDMSTAGELAQFQYWLLKHQGSVFVKIIGSLSRRSAEH